jgi:hypothetical protein
VSPTPPRPEPAPALASREHLRQAALNRARARGAVVAQRRLAWRWALFLLGRSLLALGLAALLAAALLAGLWQAQWRVVPAAATSTAPATLPEWAHALPPPVAECLAALNQGWPWRPHLRPYLLPAPPPFVQPTVPPSPSPASAPAASATIPATNSPPLRSQAP